MLFRHLLDAFAGVLYAVGVRRWSSRGDKMSEGLDFGGFPRFPIGAVVQVIGPSTAGWSGRCGVVVERLDCGRLYGVRLQGQTVDFLRRELRLVVIK